MVTEEVNSENRNSGRDSDSNDRGEIEVGIVREVRIVVVIVGREVVVVIVIGRRVVVGGVVAEGLENPDGRYVLGKDLCVRAPRFLQNAIYLEVERYRPQCVHDAMKRDSRLSSQNQKQ